MNNPYSRPLARFWWLLIVGVLVAALAALLVVYDVAWPPNKLVKRDRPTYEASTQVLVNSASNPFFRTAVEPPEPPASVAEGEEGGNQRTRVGGAIIGAQSPDVDTLVTAANYLPFFVVGDEVAQLREESFGAIPGTVEAHALFARETARGLRESPIPVIVITATSGSEENAVRLSEATTESFIAWLTAQQDAAGVPEDQRVLIQPLRSAEVTVTQGSSLGLAIFVGLAALVGFIALAYLLDRMFPRDRDRAEGAVEEPASPPAPVTATSRPAVIHSAERESTSAHARQQ